MPAIRRFVAFVLLLLAGAAPASLAQYPIAGSLDPTFQAALDPGFPPDPNTGRAPFFRVETVLVQPWDGKILVGTVSSAPFAPSDSEHYRIQRLNSDGSADPAFRPGRDDLLLAAVQPADGKVLAITFRMIPPLGLVRLNPDGGLDTGFRYQELDSVRIFTVAAALDGKIVVGGDYVAPNNLSHGVLFRLNADGSPDTGFRAAEAITAPGFGAAGVDQLVFQPDGKLLVRSATGLTRLLPDGSADPDFLARVPGTDGHDISTFALLADGKFIVAVSPRPAAFPHFFNTLYRLNPDGSQDSSFVADPAVLNPRGSAGLYGLDPRVDLLGRLAVLPDGKLVFNSRGDFGASVVRLKANGERDHGFEGGLPHVVSDPRFPAVFSQEIRAVTAQPDGRLLVASGPSSPAPLLRLRADPPAKLAELTGGFDGLTIKAPADPNTPAASYKLRSRLHLTNRGTATARNFTVRAFVSSRTDFASDPRPFPGLLDPTVEPLQVRVSTTADGVIQLTLSDDPAFNTFGAGNALGIPKLSKGARLENLAVRWNIPAERAERLQGKSLILAVDADQSVNEHDETNNVIEFHPLP